MTASRLPSRLAFATRLRRSPASLIIPGILVIIGCILLGSFGPTQLKCQQLQPQQAQCNLYRSAVFGLVERSNLQIDQVQRAKLDIQQRVRIEANNASFVSRQVINVYGVFIVGEQTILFDGYTPNQAWHEQEIIAPVNQWLLNGRPEPLILKFRNPWLDLFTIIVWAIALLWTYKVLYPPTPGVK